MPTQRSSHLDAFPKITDGDLALLRLFVDHQAIPFDQLACLFGKSVPSVRTQALRLKQVGLLGQTSYAIDPHPWFWLTGPGARRVRVRGFAHPPNPVGLNHRRTSIQARLALTEQVPGGRWITPRGSTSDARPAAIPDGIFEYEGQRWACEVELARKGTKKVRDHLDLLLQDYDKVIYFCSQQVLSCLESLQADRPRLEVQEAPTAPHFTPPVTRRVRGAHRATATQVELLRRIVEEGAVAVDQLACLLGCDLTLLQEDLAEMERHGLIERGFRLPGSLGWVWCTARGTAASNTSLGRVGKPGPAYLPRRRALMWVRLSLTGPDRAARWITKRMLGRGLERGINVEMAVLEDSGKRSAIVVSQTLVFSFLARRTTSRSFVGSSMLCSGTALPCRSSAPVS